MFTTPAFTSSAVTQRSHGMHAIPAVPTGLSGPVEVPQPAPDVVELPDSPHPVRHPPPSPPEFPSEIPPLIQDPPAPGAHAPVVDPGVHSPQAFRLH